MYKPSYTRRTYFYAHINPTRLCLQRQPFSYSKPRPQRKPRGRGQYINPERFVRVATPTDSESYQTKHSFSDFTLDKRLQQNIDRKGYVTPTPIQDQTIALGLLGKDVIGIAGTGTGKTAAFALPILHRILNDNTSRALIVAPTRELAQQIASECRSMAQGSNIASALILREWHMVHSFVNYAHDHGSLSAHPVA
ncbi:DEAD/DEAH box helicase [Candidatus Saccharibacteria bacterium]|nr:MAG: DEAD/DEAH box helicase [Candidatus Saccharibacteria bacterium]